MEQINLIEAIKFVQNNFEHFTDKQLHTFHLEAKIEIAKRKNKNNYNPKVSIRADKANEIDKNNPSKRRGDDKMDEEVKKILDDHETRIKAIEEKIAAAEKKNLNK